jgi:predicted ATPase/DNA-binding CsgD family transcriptional regulator
VATTERATDRDNAAVGPTSAREDEVLGLVGDGLTNAQIAGRLFISVRTVESHVSALLRKLELPDRHALAAHVARATAGSGGGLRGAPEAFTSFVGRRDDLAAVADALANARLVTLTGPGGIGKTRLAIQAGRQASYRAKWFVDLVPAGAAQVITTIATAVGAAERSDRSLEEAVHEAVSAQPALVVLDNCEHVLDAAAAAIQQLLRACPDTTIMTTSREVIGVPGEHVVPVRPLAVFGAEEGAIALFVARARAADANLADTDRDAIAEICTRLDGIPLALELAAARCGTLGVDGVLEALGDRFRLLAGARGVDVRHRSLRAVLDWSYSLLDEDERAMLRHVSSFQGGFRLADAVAVANRDIDPGSAADAVARLASKSLVSLVRDETGGSRYRLLETVRAYGGDRLVEAGETGAVGDLHLEWAIAVAGELEAEMEAGDSVPVRLDAVFDDLRAALAWSRERGRRADAYLLALRIAHLAYGRRFVSEAQTLYRAAAADAPDDAAAGRAIFDAAHASFAMMRGDLGYECLLEAAERAERGGDRETAAYALALATERGHRFMAEFAELPDRRTLDELLERARSMNTPADGPAAVQVALAAAWTEAMSAGAEIEPVVNEAVAAALRSGDPVFESSALDALSAAAWQGGRLAQSAQICLERVALLDRMKMHDPRAGDEQLDILHMACDVPLSRGDLVGALAFSRDAIGHPLGAAAPYLLQRELVMGLCLTGAFDEAIDEALAMRHAWERSGRPTSGWMAPAVYLTALVYGLRGPRAEFDSWWALGDEICLAPENAVRAFTAVRLALHDGRLDDAVEALDHHRDLQPAHDSEFPWSLTALGYEGYLWATAAEVWAARGEAGTAERIRQLRVTFAEHLWAGPCLLRAEGRLLGDDGLLRAAADGFAAIDAHFEESATLALR